MWLSYGAGTLGSRLALDAFQLVAILVLGSGTVEVSVLAAVGLAAGSLVALPLGPWVEFRRKRPVMIGTDVLRFLALLSVPVAYGLGVLGFVQLAVVSVIVTAANIAFTAASGAYLKALLPPADLLVANGRFEATQWTATAVGPPLGGAAIGVFGPVTTVVLDAFSHLLSALGLRAIGPGHEPPRARPVDARRSGPREAMEGWRHILRRPPLRLLFFNTILVNSLIMATAPLLAVLLLRDLGFAPWQYGLAFAVPCLGGLLGSRLAPPLVARFGQRRVLLASGTVRACWPVGLAGVQPGWWGLALLVVIEFGLITSMGVFNPVFATYRLRHTADDRVARTLTAWTITKGATVAVLTVCWGLLANTTGPRTALALAGALILATPLLLPWRDGAPPAHGTGTSRASTRRPLRTIGRRAASGGPRRRRTGPP
ncbi:MFS transporter [Streptomyces armeniacus]|uniref:MFS transporter n=1 Tax=Streptomyces armeniacus TaxID=83291 RepID=A0A345Y124_9ACTN|nr:MFS transporter [Streptomyces armeniacus]